MAVNGLRPALSMGAAGGYSRIVVAGWIRKKPRCAVRGLEANAEGFKAVPY